MKKTKKEQDMKQVQTQTQEQTATGMVAAQRKPKARKKKKAPIIIAIILIAIVVINIVSCALKPAAGAIVTTTKATRGELQETVSTSGTVVSEEKKVFFAPVSGTIASVDVAAGDAVSSGSALMSYDMEQMEDFLTQAALQQKKSDAGYQGMLANNAENQGKLNEANTNLDVLNQQIADNKSYLKDLQEQLNKNQRDTGNSLANENYNLNEKANKIQQEMTNLDPASQEYADKAAELQNINTQISKNQYLQSIAGSSDYVAKMNQEIADVTERIAGYEEYKARMESQKATSEGAVLDGYDKTQYDADKELAAMSYQDAETDYYEAKQGICAEFDGIVTSCEVVSGTPVTEGTPLLTLESSNNVKISFYASKQDLEKLAVGQKAVITISGHIYDGEVQKINRMAEKNESNTPMVGAEVHILNPDENIILGMDAKLQINTRNTENALLIPVEAINADRDGDFLYVVENGVAVRKPVICGISSDTFTEILEGITEEDEIILTALTGIDEGMPVTVMPEIPQMQQMQ